MPHNGSAHNLRASPVEGSSRGYSHEAKQLERPLRRQPNRGRGVHSQLVKRPVRFRGLLDGATADERSRSDGLAVVAIQSTRHAEALERQKRRTLPPRDGLNFGSAAGLRRTSPAHLNSQDERASSRRTSSTRKPQTQSPRRRASARRLQPRSQARPNPIFNRI